MLPSTNPILMGLNITRIFPTQIVMLSLNNQFEFNIHYDFYQLKVFFWSSEGDNGLMIVWISFIL